MTAPNNAGIKEVDLPFSNGLLSARMWKAHGRCVVGVPKLGIHCYGKTESEAAFRLFTTLLKYYRQLKNNQSTISEKGALDLVFLTKWMEEIEKKMTAPENNVVSITERIRR